MSNKNKFRNNHFVPEAFLKGWAKVVEDKTQGFADIWLWREGKVFPPKYCGKPLSGTPFSQIACGNYLYVIEENGIEVNSEPTFFQDIHDNGGKVITGLRNGSIDFQKLSSEQRRNLDLYFASFRAMNPQQMKKDFDFYLSDKSFLKKSLTKDDDSLHIHNSLIGKEGKATQPGISAISAVLSTKIHSKNLGETYWGFRELASPALLMSDNPIPHLLEERVTFLPISRKQVLLIAKDKESLFQYLYQKNDALLAKATNLGVMKHATQVIDTDVDVAPQFIEKHIAWGVRLSQTECENIYGELNRQMANSN